MCTPAAAIASMSSQLAGGIYSAVQQGQAGDSKTNYYNDLADLNNKRADIVDTNTEKSNNATVFQASQQDQKIENQAQQIEAAQSAGMSANGLDVGGSTTAQQLVQNTADQALNDQSMIRYNADQAIYANNMQGGYQSADLRSQGRQYQTAGRMAGIESANNQFATLLGTVSSVGSQAFQYGKEGVFKDLFSSGDSATLGSKAYTQGPNLLPSEMQNPQNFGVMSGRPATAGPSIEVGSLTRNFEDSFSGDPMIPLSYTGRSAIPAPSLLGGKQRSGRPSLF